jgi:hypothetical protein
MEAKRCISCGMPMSKDEEFAAGDRSKDWCRYCARPDGSLKSYDEALIGMTGFLVRSQGIDEKAAQAAAKEMMATMPAWRKLP